ncbi:chloride channel protein [Flavobacterium sp. GSP27]|uniref:Chloride channel protein n=1 Tax=Flavobacterium bomense TaxID=2497483 RepID=A0A3S0MDF5_9FLAO|nr:MULTISPECIES: chloride channel protein [Flavobacterium]RTY89165.1 chloride channel protein [Flavobacterium sp. GSN2]RTY82260.1 chloride channel protein [Flavobacterium sp. ZB4P23]RTY90184.1 chloride channel protein [Flavobacterium sp. RSP46]RTZ05149.1 chloride channel protein [Flavobacterium bomense]RTZ09721.1 chloride channel protein [Flavobacterium sp. GSP27]
MNTTARIKKNYRFIKFRKLVIVSVLIGFLSAFLGVILKNATEYYEEIFFHQATINPLFLVIFPVFGLSIIYFLREYLFKKKENKGIKEIFESTNSKSKNLPSYKIPSHFINGLLTVVFGGSTGIEVSTVVASATIGSVAQRKQNVFRQYKTELICAGIAAGITAIFSSPIAGILFAIEVISRKVTRAFLLSNLIAVAIAFGLVFLLDEKPLFAVNITTWHLKAIPYFILLGILSGLNSVYLTRSVLFFKAQFTRIKIPYFKIIIGSLILSSSLFLFPQLYGEGYHAIKTIFVSSNEMSLTFPLALTIIGIIILKPIVTSATLASGGDGGVFAPSLFMGAFLGLLLALVTNTYFNAHVIPINFIIMGMAAVLSASIHAPFTSIFLVCGLTNDYTLFIPILLVCLISKYTAKMIYPFTVYSYSPSLIK